MKLMSASSRSRGDKHQRGVSLVIVLVLLVVMTLIGVLSLRGTILQERMAGGSYDRSLSFQAAEQALRVAERAITGFAGNFTAEFPGSGCTVKNIAVGAGTQDVSFCARPTPNQAERWASITCQEGAPWVTVDNTDTRVSDPRYIIELMGPVPPPWNPGCGKTPNDTCQMLDSYRVTACSGNPAAGRAITVLQTTFIKG